MIKFEDDFSPKGAVIKGEWYAADYSKRSNIEERLHNFFDVMRERHAIYLRRAAGLPKPWTNDPILRDNRFCCSYRELDTVSVWIIENIIKPYEDNKDLPFMLAAARLINWPPTLKMLFDAGCMPTNGKWNPDVAYKTLLTKKALKGEAGKIITGAYIVNSIIPKDHQTDDHSKAYYIPYIGLKDVWYKREELAAAGRSTLEEFVNLLKT